MEDKNKKETLDKNFFKAMNYELAGEIGVIDNEDMKNNRRLNSHEENEDKKNKK